MARPPGPFTCVSTWGCEKPAIFWGYNQQSWGGFGTLDMGTNHQNRDVSPQKTHGGLTGLTFG